MPLATLHLTPHDVRRVAVEAGVDPRTVTRYIEGKPVTSTCAARVRRAIMTLGYALPPEASR